MSSHLTVVGAGRVGVSLAADLVAGDLFEFVTVVGRRPDPPPILSGVPGVRYLQTPAARAASADPDPDPDPDPDASADPDAPPVEAIPAGGEGREERVLLFSVSDDSLAAVSAAWARTLAGRAASPGIALHTSGLHGSEILAPLRTAGWAVGSWHPLVALADPRRGGFAGFAVGVEGDEAAAEMAARLAEAVGARVLRVRSESKARYHAGAVFGSNFLVACLSVALRELRAACLDEVGPADLLPLARSAVDNLSAGLVDGATGPVVRGDAGTISRHLEALDGDAAALYRALASELLRTAALDLPGPARERLARALAPADPDAASGL